MPRFLPQLRVAAALAGLALPATATAQSDIPARVGKLEGEMRAVQRKVFPGGGGPYLQPEVSAPPVTSAAPGIPATSAVADLTSRVASLESQMASLTGQAEQNQYKLRLLQDQFDAYKRQTDSKLAMFGTAGGPLPDASPPGDAGPVRRAPPPRLGTSGSPGVRAPLADDDERSGPVTAVDRASPGGAASVERPATGDPAEDAYLYGYRLWAAKRYPEAEAQLKKVVADYPTSRRASYAQNLLGRSYLDEGKPSLASMAFYDNYKKLPDGERAPESLYYLAQALMRLNKPVDACRVYGELSDVYGGKIAADMKAKIARGRVVAKCQ